ncbi:AAA family ATPase [Ectopseudomonas khazarica]|uniref:AAA family ATPase n=1 Tax=Ectopseudomonas khazarica TaxID=2502979 RepID=UPI003B9390D2
MRITEINVTNFQGLRNAALVVSAPVLLVAGHNGAGKSSLLDAISMAFTGQPRRVNLKKDMGQLVTEGQKKGEAHVAWVDDNGAEETSWVMLPKGNTAPLLDLPYLPFVLDASKFASLDSKERRRMLFDLTGASAKPDDIAKRLADKGADKALVEKIKPMLRSGFPAAADQAKENASEARGAWKQLTGENYGSDKAEGWEPQAVQVSGIEQSHIDQVAEQLKTLEQDMAEAQQTLGGHKAAKAAAAQRQQRIADLTETAGLLERRQAKLIEDEKRRDEWDAKLADARRAAEGGPSHDPIMCPHCNGELELHRGAPGERIDIRAYVAPEKVADPEAAKRVTEYSDYLDSALRAVANSKRDVEASQNAAAQVQALQDEAAAVPNDDAIANAEQVINDMRQERDALNAKRLALQEALDAASGRADLIAEAERQHGQVKAWSLIADALGPNGIPSEILADAIGPINKLLASHSASTGWAQVQISDSIDVTFGGRLYGLLSESEKWRCDALLSAAIAKLSGLGLLVLDRLDVLDLPSRGQALKWLMQLTKSGDLQSVIVAGTLKQPMDNPPPGVQAVWIDGGIIAQPQAKAA